MSLQALKKQNSLDALLGAVQKENQPLEKKSYVDERIWKPVMDKTGNGYAVIRFLPMIEGESLPWVNDIGITDSKARQVSGILRTLSLLLDRMIPCQR